MGIRKGLWTALICAAIGSMALAASANATVLIDENSGGSGNGFFSQHGTTGTPVDSEVADDFTVPPNTTWTIRGIEVSGKYDFGAGPISGVNVRFYTDNAATHVPDVLDGQLLGLIPVNGLTGPNFSIALPGSVLANPTASPLTEWISVQAELGGYPTNVWDWSDRAPLVGFPAAARSSRTGGGIAPGCPGPGWVARDTVNCAGPDGVARDQMFSLSDTAPTAPPSQTTNAPPGNPTSPINPAGHLRKRKCKKAKKHHAAAAKKKKCGKKRR